MSRFLKKLFGKNESVRVEPTLDQQTFFRVTGNFEDNPYSKILRQSFDSALYLQHKLPESILNLEGMSGRKYRYFINNLIAAIKDPRYLEVGSWKGSTACAAMFGNAIQITCVDNWSEFDGPKDVFLENINHFKSEQVNFSFIEGDFRKVDYSSLGPFNVYLFDGPHSFDEQFDGVTLAQPALDDTYILIVDDWNWKAPREGTVKALSELNVEVISSIEVFTCLDDSPVSIGPYVIFQHSDWHNGYFFAVCRKKS